MRRSFTWNALPFLVVAVTTVSMVISRPAPAQDAGGGGGDGGAGVTPAAPAPEAPPAGEQSAEEKQGAEEPGETAGGEATEEGAGEEEGGEGAGESEPGKKPPKVYRAPRPDVRKSVAGDELPPIFGQKLFQQKPSSLAPVEMLTAPARPGEPFTRARVIPVPPTYTVGPGDELQVRFSTPFRTEETFDVVVDPQGQVEFPVVGPVTVRDLTVPAVQNLLRDSFLKFYKQARVRVSLGRLRTIHVFVSGEVRTPGAYTLSSLTTAFNALYASGGPADNGTMRRIALNRDGKRLKDIDLYQYLLTGDRTADLRLQTGDELFVPVVGPLVAVVGEVRRPARFELLGQERLLDVLTMAGGIKAGGYAQRLILERITRDGVRRVVDVDAAGLSPDDEKNNLQLRDGDVVRVQPVSSLRRNVVYADGVVERPGAYEFVEGMRVSDLLNKALGARPDQEIFLGRADLVRLRDSGEPEVIPVELAKVLTGNRQADLELRAWDRLMVYGAEEKAQPRVVSVEGYITKPGDFERTANMTVSDLLFQAGPLLPRTYLPRAELFRLMEDGSTNSLSIDLRAAQAHDPKQDVVLQDADRLVLYSVEQAEAKWLYRKVRIEGAVQRPDEYQRTEGMRVSDLVFQAGDLLVDAYRPRAEISRLLEDGSRKVIALNLDRALRGDSADNLALENQDVLRVYTLQEAESRWRYRTVRITGAVQRPGPFERMQGMKVSDLVFRAGGLLMDAHHILQVARTDEDGSQSVFTVDMDAVKNGDEKADVVLQDGDTVFAPQRYGRIGKVDEVSLEGEIASPGPYPISPERNSLYQVLQAAGGLTPAAFARGAVLQRQLRYMNPTSQRAAADEIQENLERRRRITDQVRLQLQVENPQALPGATVSSPGETAPREEVLAAAAEEAAVDTETKVSKQVAEAAPVPTEEAAMGRVIIDLETLLASGGEVGDVQLYPGDRLIVPRRPSTVTVVGAVARPASIQYVEGESVWYYVERCGGLTEDAAWNRMLLVRADGSTQRLTGGTAVLLGDIIVVPTRNRVPERSWLTKFADAVKPILDTATALFIISELRRR